MLYCLLANEIFVSKLLANFQTISKHLTMIMKREHCYIRRDTAQPTDTIQGQERTPKDEWVTITPVYIITPVQLIGKHGHGRSYNIR